MLTDRDIPILIGLSSYFLMNRRQIQEEWIPNDTGGRQTRRRLSMMVKEGYIYRENQQVVNPRDGSVCIVYRLAKKGREFVASHLKDHRIRLKPLQIRQPQHLFHYLAVTDTHLIFDRAIRVQANVDWPVTLDHWFNEDEIVNVDEADRSQHFNLETVLELAPRKLISDPDAAFQLTYKDHAAVFYLEQDRNTTWRDRVAARKAPAYAKLLEQRRHKTHFPDTTLEHFYIVCVAPNGDRRDELRKAFTGKPEARLWRFASMEDLTPNSILHEPIWYRCSTSEPEPLIKR